MPKSELLERASLEYLKELAKDRLQQLRRIDPKTKLADALLATARDYGFPSWRALKAEVEQRETGDISRFFEACESGDAAGLRLSLARNPNFVLAENPKAQHRGWTGLHAAAAKTICALAPPMVTVTGSTACLSAVDVISPVIPAGIVIPAPVAKIWTTDSRGGSFVPFNHVSMRICIK
jgi:hypothetical protein